MNRYVYTVTRITISDGSRRIGRRTETNTATVRGYIPAKIEPHDTTQEIVEVFGVSYGTACVWLRILRGPTKRN